MDESERIRCGPRAPQNLSIFDSNSNKKVKGKGIFRTLIRTHTQQVHFILFVPRELGRSGSSCFLSAVLHRYEGRYKGVGVFATRCPVEPKEMLLIGDFAYTSPMPKYRYFDQYLSLRMVSAIILSSNVEIPPNIDDVFHF